MSNKIVGVIGSFCFGGDPLAREMPRFTISRSQLSSSGLGKTASVCSNLIILKYPGVPVCFKVGTLHYGTH